MLIDTRTTFAWETAIPTATGTAKLGESLDLSVEANQGEGYPLYAVISVATTATSAGAATVAFELVTADATNLTTGAVVLVQTPAFALADLTAGAQLLVVAIPKADYKRFLGVRAVVGTAALTAGAATAFLTQDPPAWRAYEEGTN